MAIVDRHSVGSAAIRTLRVDLSRTEEIVNESIGLGPATKPTVLVVRSSPQSTQRRGVKEADES